MCLEITDMVLKMSHQFHESLKEEKRGTGCHFPFQQAKMSRPFHKAPQRFLLQVVCVCQSGPHSQLPEEVSS